MPKLRVGLLLLLVLAFAGCGDAPNAAQTPARGSSPVGGGNLTVFAAASLQDALNEIDAEVEETITFNFAGSQVLVTQLREGARADLLITADKESMDAAVENGTVESGSEQVVATNRLVVATAPGSSAVASLSDLAKPGVKLVLAEESVPAGRYSLQALDKLSADPAYGAGFKERVLNNVVSHETNVRQTLAKVALGEADAGIVYATDARHDGKVGTVVIPEAANVLARYYGAPIKAAANRQAAFLFLGYLLSEDGQANLAKYGFGPAESK
jgi:molybdate transport system substrate-binding protein